MTTLATLRHLHDEANAIAAALSVLEDAAWLALLTDNTEATQAAYHAANEAFERASAVLTELALKIDAELKGAA